MLCNLGNKHMYWYFWVRVGHIVINIDIRKLMDNPHIYGSSIKETNTDTKFCIYQHISLSITIVRLCTFDIFKKCSDNSYY